MTSGPQHPPSSRERLEKVLAVLDARKGDERTFLAIFPAAARASADAADERRRTGREISPLDGAIVSVKDIFDVAGETTTAGSPIRRDEPPATRDALIVERLRAAGAVLLGKTNLNEFCFTSDGVNPHYGTPGNVRDPRLIPGGSSSGAGVSVAEGTSEISIGSDTGGSVRIPAALNGVVGFKPTARRIPLDGAFPLSPTLDSIGPLAASVAACAAADAVMAGSGKTGVIGPPLAGLRLGIPRGCLFDDTDAAIETGFERALAVLRNGGAAILDHSIDDLLAEMRDATAEASIASVEAAAIHAGWLNSGAIPGDPRTERSLRRRLDFPAWKYLRMVERRNALCEAMERRLRTVDALAMPTLPIFAPPIDLLTSDRRAAAHISELLLRNTQVANQFDLTAISLPLPGLALPAGLTLVARRGRDRAFLALAVSVEEALARQAR